MILVTNTRTMMRLNRWCLRDTVTKLTAAFYYRKQRKSDSLNYIFKIF